MKTGLPGWTRWLAGVAGVLDATTGAGLVWLPAWTLQRMGVAPPGAEALEFVRFVGVFVGAVGASYLSAAWRGQDRALRAVIDVTRWFRGGAGLFTGVMVVAGAWSPAWLAVTITDLVLLAGQTVVLGKYADE